jgi:hypothetical protein
MPGTCLRGHRLITGCVRRRSPQSRRNARKKRRVLQRIDDEHRADPLGLDRDHRVRTGAGNHHQRLRILAPAANGQVHSVECLEADADDVRTHRVQQAFGFLIRRDGGNQVPGGREQRFGEPEQGAIRFDKQDEGRHGSAAWRTVRHSQFCVQSATKRQTQGPRPFICFAGAGRGPGGLRLRSPRYGSGARNAHYRAKACAGAASHLRSLSTTCDEWHREIRSALRKLASTLARKGK